MKRYIKSTRWVTYEGNKLPLENGETKPQAIARYRERLAKELEAERIAKADKEKARAERRKIPKYKEHDIVLGKDGRYYELFEPYYNEPDDTVYYSSVPTNPEGKWDIPEDDDDYRWGDLGGEISQNEIQRKIR